MKSQFTSTENKGFQMTFANGITISVQFGRGNYCEKRNAKKDEYIHSSKDAEMSIWNELGEHYRFPDGTISDGWLSTKEVAQWIARCEKATSIETI